jgi:hypothetical protein
MNGLLLTQVSQSDQASQGTPGHSIHDFQLQLA